MTLNPGEILGDRYQILRNIGRSDLGQTYLVNDLQQNGKQFVIKEFIPQIKSLEQLQQAQILFEKEATPYHQLDHPQIPSLPETFLITNQDQGNLFLVQNYIEGYSYLQLLKIRQSRGKSLNEREVTHLLVNILPVLDYIHHEGIIHSAICPNNLILGLSERLPLLTDFGWIRQLARQLNSQFLDISAPALSQLGLPGGKMGYAPPEQIQRGFIFPHSDIYALGATSLVLLTGKNQKQLMNPLTYQWSLPEDLELSSKMADILLQMLDPAPGHRFQTAKELLIALKYQRTIDQDNNYTQPQNITVSSDISGDNLANSALELSASQMQNNSENSLPKITWVQRLLLGFGISFFLLLLILGAGFIGWIGGKTWVRQTAKQQTETQAEQEFPEIIPEGTVFDDFENNDTNNEGKWQGSREVRQLVRQLRIKQSFFINLVNQIFWEKYPQQQGIILSDRPEDREQQEQWDQIAQELLQKLSFLSVESLRSLGSYTLTQQDSWKREVNQLRLSSRALYDLADGAFNYYFPGYKYSNSIEEPLNQIWNAIVLDRLRKLQSGESYERLEIAPNDFSVTSSNTLKPGTGKAYSIYLNSGKDVNFNLKTVPDVLLSIYTPTGTFTILEDSRKHNWSGTLPETGFYEITIVSESSTPINYQLELTSQNQ
jgi:serine/threonine protein kinase, bacterial